MTIRLFGFEVRRIPPELPPLERMKTAVDDLNQSWTEFAANGNPLNIRPWIIWEERRIVLSSYKAKPEIIHE